METARSHVYSDILIALDDKQCVLLIILDLFAAFDMFSHPTLLSILASVIGMSGKTLDCFFSYLSESVQSVFIEGMESSLWNCFLKSQRVCVRTHSFYNLRQPTWKISTKQLLKSYVFHDAYD